MGCRDQAFIDPLLETLKQLEDHQYKLESKWVLEELIDYASTTENTYLLNKLKMIKL